jgi:hypothetical protein
MQYVMVRRTWPLPSVIGACRIRLSGEAPEGTVLIVTVAGRDTTTLLPGGDELAVGSTVETEVGLRLCIPGQSELTEEFKL